MKTLFHDSHEHIDGYGDPDLSIHGVLGGAIERLDPEVLLNPFEEKEEQLDLPAALVQLCNGQGWQDKVIGQEDQPIDCLRVVELDPTDLFRVLLSGIEAGEDIGLIADQITGTIDLRAHSPELGIGLGSDDEEGLREMCGVEPGVIRVASVHDIERTGLRNEIVKNIDIVDLAVGDEGKCRNTSSQIEQGMEFDCSFRLEEVCPGEQGQAQVDSGGIKRIDGSAQDPCRSRPWHRAIVPGRSTPERNQHRYTSLVSHWLRPGCFERCCPECPYDNAWSEWLAERLRYHADFHDRSTERRRRP